MRVGHLDVYRAFEGCEGGWGKGEGLVLEVRSGALIHDGVEDVATTIGGSGGSEICTVQKIGGMDSTKVKR